MRVPSEGDGSTETGSMAGIDLTDLGNFADGFPHHLFRLHRQVSPVYWHDPTPHTPDGEGFWSVATHAEVLEVLRDPATYSSQGGGHREHGGTLLQDLPAAGQVLNMMDDPRHAQIRRIVSAGLTPRMIRRVEDDIRQRVRRLLDAVRDGITFDFLRTVAAELPMQMICVLLGVPEEDRHWLFEAVEPGFDVRDGRMAFESSGDRSNPATARMFEYGTRLIEQKRRHPGDDMLSAVANAPIDDASGGEGGRGALSDSELYMFFSLLFSAGSETTRNAIAGGLVELAARPQQLARLRAESALIPTAIEEFVRWTSPSPSKRRTATRGCELGGRKIAPGDKVMIWEGSANRDELVFADADEFDVGRKPNPHLGFGHGVHFCLGANLARLEIKIFLEEFLPRFDRITLTEPVEWTRSNRHTGIRHLMLSLTRVAS